MINATIRLVELGGERRVRWFMVKEDKATVLVQILSELGYKAFTEKEIDEDFHTFKFVIKGSKFDEVYRKVEGVI